MPPVETYRKRPLTIETMLWDGTPQCAAQIRAWAGPRADGDGEQFFAAYELPDAPEHAQVWNAEEGCWIACPIGHRVALGAMGELYPVSPAAVAATYELVDG